MGFEPSANNATHSQASSVRPGDALRQLADTLDALSTLPAQIAALQRQIEALNRAVLGGPEHEVAALVHVKGHNGSHEAVRPW